MAGLIVDAVAVREVAAEMQKGLVSTSRGMRHITNCPKRSVVEAWRQAGCVLELLVASVPAEVVELVDAWLEDNPAGDVEVTSEDVARNEGRTRVRVFRDTFGPAATA